MRGCLKFHGNLALEMGMRMENSTRFQQRSGDDLFDPE